MNGFTKKSNYRSCRVAGIWMLQHRGMLWWLPGPTQGLDFQRPMLLFLLFFVFVRPSICPSVRHVKILSSPDFFFYVLWYIDLIFGMWLYLDELQFRFEFRSGRMIFGWVMVLELVFFVQTFSFPDFSLTSYEILIWYLV